MPPHPDAKARARAAYVQAFGREPAFVGAAPGRVNIIGEHIDYCGGAVVPFAIDRVCAVGAGEPEGGCAPTIIATDLGEKWEPPGDWGSDWKESLVHGSWGLYVGGVCALLSKRVRRAVNLNLTIASDVPMGSGLSSSAALEVAVARAVLGAMGMPEAVQGFDLARLCRQAEHEYAGVACGLMDQCAAVLCRRGHAMLLRCREPVAHEHVRLEEGATWLVVDSGVRHSLASSGYAARRAASEHAARKMGLSLLCEAAPLIAEQRNRQGAFLTDEESRALRHAVSEQSRVFKAVEALRSGDWAALGRLLYESHESLRTVLGVSCEELDVLVEAAMRTRGVWGARLVGAGFGGSVLVVAEPHLCEQAGRAIGAVFQTKFGRPCSMMRVHAGGN
jgi:galactokinase